MKSVVKDVLDFIDNNAFGCFLLALAAIWSVEEIVKFAMHRGGP